MRKGAREWRHHGFCLVRVIRPVPIFRPSFTRPRTSTLHSCLCSAQSTPIERSTLLQIIPSIPSIRLHLLWLSRILDILASLAYTSTQLANFTSFNFLILSLLIRLLFHPLPGTCLFQSLPAVHLQLLFDFISFHLNNYGIYRLSLVSIRVANVSYTYPENRNGFPSTCALS